MAVTTTTQDAECAHCHGERDLTRSVAGSFCSAGCYYRHRGKDALTKIQHDHRFCATCFRPIKTTDKPSTEWIENAASSVQQALDNGGRIRPSGNGLLLDATECEGPRPTAADAVIGHQYRTEHTVWATDDVSEEHDPPRLRQRWSCKCGNVDPAHRDDVLEDVELDRILIHLFWSLKRLSDQGTIHHRPDRRRLFDALREEWRDWPYAIGRALYSLDPE